MNWKHLAVGIAVVAVVGGLIFAAVKGEHKEKAEDVIKRMNWGAVR